MEPNARGDSIDVFTSKHPGTANETICFPVLGRSVFVWRDGERCSLILTAACCSVQMDSLGFLHLIILAASSFFPFADRHIHEPGGHVLSVALI